MSAPTSSTVITTSPRGLNRHAPTAATVLSRRPHAQPPLRDWHAARTRDSSQTPPSVSETLAVSCPHPEPYAAQPEAQHATPFRQPGPSPPRARRVRARRRVNALTRQQAAAERSAVTWPSPLSAEGSL